LQIKITKVHQLQQEPHSPKFVKRPKVWGAKSHTKRNMHNRPHMDRSANAIKERMEKRLAQMFGESQANGSAAVFFPRKHSTID